MFALDIDTFSYLKNEIFLDDCFNFLKKIPSSSIDLIAIDPPYEINYERLEWDKKGNFSWKTLCEQYYRILKKEGNLIIFQGWSNVCNTKLIFDSKFTMQNWIIYDRIKGRGAKSNLISTREDILWYTKTKKIYTFNKTSSTILKKTGGTIGKKNGNKYRGLSNVWTDISPIVPWSSEREEHPTQKPLVLLERIVKVFSNENDVVLDTFCGCGTTCIASKKLNRNYIGIEKEKKYYDIIIKRLKNVS